MAIRDHFIDPESDLAKRFTHFVAMVEEHRRALGLPARDPRPTPRRQGGRAMPTAFDHPDFTAVRRVRTYAPEEAGEIVVVWAAGDGVGDGGQFKSAA